MILAPSQLLLARLRIHGRCFSSTSASSFPNKFLIGEKHDFKRRSKCIYKLKSIETINIHCDNKFNISNPIKVNNFNLFHFFNWCRKNRKINLKKVFTI